MIALADAAQELLRAQAAAAHPDHGEHLVPVQVDERAPDHLLVAADHLLAAVEPR